MRRLRSRAVPASLKTVADLRGSTVRAALRIAGHYFDRRLGVDTAGEIEEDELGYDPAERRGYGPSRWFVLRTVLRPDEVDDQDVFVDLGSGKGRVLFEAARQYPFRRVIGVELSPGLSSLAAANLRQLKRPLKCTDIQLVTADVIRWDPPDDLTVAYMCNPFRGEVFGAAVGRLIELVDRRGRPLTIIYANPAEHDQLMATGRVRQLPVREGLLHRGLGIPHGWVRRYEIVPRSTAPAAGRLGADATST